MRILLADDDRDIRECLHDCLMSDGHAVHIAANGREALRLWRSAEGTPDEYELVILDWWMPVIDGMGVLLELPESVAVIMATAAGTPPTDFAESARRVLIRKPFDLDVLRQSIAQIRTPRETEAQPALASL